MARKYEEVMKEIAEHPVYTKYNSDDETWRTCALSVAPDGYLSKLVSALNTDVRDLLRRPAPSYHDPVGDLVAICFEAPKRKNELEELKDRFVSDLRKRLPALYELAKTSEASLIGQIIRDVEKDSPKFKE